MAKFRHQRLGGGSTKTTKDVVLDNEASHLSRYSITANEADITVSFLDGSDLEGEA